VVLVVGCSGCERLFGGGEGGGGAAGLSQTAPAPAQPLVPPDDVVATVNDVPISQTDVELRIEEIKLQTQLMNPEQEWTSLSVSEVGEVLDELIQAEAMSQHAVTSGRLRATETQHRWAFMRRGFLAQEWLRHQQERIVSNADIERYYEENKAGFQEPARIRLRQLTVATETEARQALARLHGESADFAEVARELSIGPTAAQGGLVSSWVMRADEKLFLYGSEQAASADGVLSLDPTLEAAAFAIDGVGGISNYVKGPDDRYHTFQLVERREGRLRPLGELWDGIKQFLLAQKLQETVDQLVTEAQVQRFPERLEAIPQ
jgi:hypothetical protein